MAGNLIPDLFDAMRAKAVVNETSFHLSIQLVLRAILLKLNSEEAHKCLKDQILEQVRAVAKLWIEQERGTIRDGFVNGLFKEDQFDLLEKRIGELETDLVKETCSHVEAMFEKPKDLAGIY